jgi:hypothetical protein
MRTRTIVLIGSATVAVAALVAVLVVVTRPPSPTGLASAQKHPFSVDLGPTISPRAASVQVGESTYQLRPGPGSTRITDVDLSDDTAGVAFVHDAQNHLIATAPIWSMPNLDVSDLPATCATTAFDQVLLTPGVSTSNPLTVDILWALANQGAAAADLAGLGSAICDRLPGDPASLASPKQGEIDLYRKLIDDLMSAVASSASGLPPAAVSLRGLGAATSSATPTASGTGPTTTASSPPHDSSSRPSGYRMTNSLLHVAGAIGSARLTAQQDTGCTGGAAPVIAADGPPPVLSLCAADARVKIVNSSEAWQVLFANHASLSADPLAIVPGQQPAIPSLTDLVAAVLHDEITADLATGCKVLSFFHLCKEKAPDRSELLKLLRILEPGEQEAETANGYYSIGWGNGRGVRGGLPPGASQSDIDHLIGLSRGITWFTATVLPFVSLVIDKRLDADIPRSQLSKSAPILDRLAEMVVTAGANGNPTNFQDQVLAGINFVKSLLNDPELLGAILEVVVPGQLKLAEDLAKKLAEYLAETEIPVAGWAALVIEVINKGASAANAFISIVNLFDAAAMPSYGWWPGTLTLAGAAAMMPANPTPDSQPRPCPVVAANSDRIPGAPADVRCVWTIAADLDGNGRPDYLVTWQSPQHRGAVALLDDGSVHQLDNGSVRLSDDTRSWSTSTLTGSGPPTDDLATPTSVFTAGEAGTRQQVLIADNEGVHGNGAVVIGYTSDDHLRLVVTPAGLAMVLESAADLGCAMVSGHKRFAVTVDDFGPGATGPYAWISSSFYTLNDTLTLTPAGYAGSVIPAAKVTRTMSNDCKEPLPAVSLGTPATSPAAAVTALLQAAKHHDTVAASAVIGGSPGGDAFQPDSYDLLTSGPAASLTAWAAGTPHCQPSPEFDGVQVCSVTSAGGDAMAAEVRQREFGNWVVDGIFTGP